jgi:hypothetical protein
MVVLLGGKGGGVGSSGVLKFWSAGVGMADDRGQMTDGGWAGALPDGKFQIEDFRWERG